MQQSYNTPGHSFSNEPYLTADAAASSNHSASGNPSYASVAPTHSTPHLSTPPPGPSTTTPPVTPRRPLRATRTQPTGGPYVAEPGSLPHSAAALTPTVPPLMTFSSDYGQEDSSVGRGSARPRTIGGGSVRLAGQSVSASTSARLSETYGGGPRTQASSWGPTPSTHIDGYFSSGGSASYQRPVQSAMGTGSVTVPLPIQSQPLPFPVRTLPGIIKTTVEQTSGAGGSGDASGPLSDRPHTTAGGAPATHMSPHNGSHHHGAWGGGGNANGVAPPFHNPSSGGRGGSPHGTASPLAAAYHLALGNIANTAVPTEASQGGGRESYALQSRTPRGTSLLPDGTPRTALQPQKVQTARGSGARAAVHETDPSVPSQRVLHISGGSGHHTTVSPMNDTIMAALTVSRAQPQSRPGKSNPPPPPPPSGPQQQGTSAVTGSATPRRATKRTGTKEDTPRRGPRCPKTSSSPTGAQSTRSSSASPPQKQRGARGARTARPRPSTRTTSNDSTGYHTVEKHAPVADGDAERTARTSVGSGPSHTRRHRHRASGKTGKQPRMSQQSAGITSPTSVGEDGSCQSSDSDSTLTHTSVSEGRQNGVDSSDMDGSERRQHSARRARSDGRRTKGTTPAAPSVGSSSVLDLADTSPSGKKKKSKGGAAAKVDQPPHLSPPSKRGTAATSRRASDSSTLGGGGGGGGGGALGSPRPSAPPSSHTHTLSGSLSCSGGGGLHHGTAASGRPSSSCGSSAIRRGSEGAAVLPCSTESKANERPGTSGPHPVDAAMLTSPVSLQSTSFRSAEECLRSVRTSAREARGVDTAMETPPRSTASPTTAAADANGAITPPPLPLGLTSPVKGCTRDDGASVRKERKQRTSGSLRSGSVGTSRRQGSPQYSHTSTGVGASPGQQRGSASLRRSFPSGGGGSPHNPPGGSGTFGGGGGAAARASVMLPGAAAPTASMLLNAEYIKKVKEQRRREFYAWNELSRKRAEGDENAV